MIENQKTAEQPLQSSPAVESDSKSQITDSSADTTDKASEETRYGRLNPEARRCLVTLLKQGVILGSDKRLLYEALCRNETEIRDHLADMFLDLMLDTRSEIGVLRQIEANADDEHSESHVKLIQRRPLTLYDSLVLLILRKHYQQRENIGETKVLIEHEQIAAQLLPFLPLSNNSALDQRKLNGSIEKLEKHKICSRVRGDADRLEITPAIRYVVDSSFLEKLETQYLNIARDSGKVATKPEAKAAHAPMQGSSAAIDDIAPASAQASLDVQASSDLADEPPSDAPDNSSMQGSLL